MISQTTVTDACNNDIIKKQLSLLAQGGAMQLQDEKHYTTITNWPKGAVESSTEDNMFTFVG